MSPERIRQMTTFLAVRTGNTNRAALAQDVGTWTRMAAAHTGAVAPTPLAVQNQMPAQTFIALTALRHERLLAAGREQADNGANVAQLRSGLRQETQYLNAMPEEGHFGRRLAAQSDRATRIRSGTSARSASMTRAAALPRT